MEGKGRDGTDLSPTYLEDPYFKTKEAAQRYSDWKDKITPNPIRKSGVPNLYINGFYHNSIGLTITSTSLNFVSKSYMGSDIERKFGERIHGLNTEKRIIYVSGFLRPDFMTKVRSELQL